MIMKVMCVFDKKLGVYVMPHFVRHVGEATRGFEDGVNDPKTSLSSHYADYALCTAGEWDDETGTLTVQPVNVILEGASVKKDLSNVSSISR